MFKGNLFFDQNATTLVTAASTTVTVTSRDIPGTGVIAYHFLFTGAGMTFGDLTRVRVKAAGVPFIDCTLAHFQAWLTRYYPKGVSPGAAATAFTIPLWLPPGMVDPDGKPLAYDDGGFPFGQAPTIELVIGAGGAAGTVQVGWTISDARPRFSMGLIGNNMNWPAGAANQQRYAFSDPGFIRALSMNTVGLTRGKAQLNGIQRANIEGTALWQETQAAWKDAGVTDPVFMDFGRPVYCPPGSNTYMEGDTAAAWVANNELTQFALRPQTA